MLRAPSTRSSVPDDDGPQPGAAPAVSSSVGSRTVAMPENPSFDPRDPDTPAGFSADVRRLGLRSRQGVRRACALATGRGVARRRTRGCSRRGSRPLGERRPRR